MDLSFFGTGSLLERFIAALLIGILVGVEREFSRREADQPAHFAGIRTFPMICLGGFSAALASDYVIWAFPAAFLFMAGLAVVAYYIRSTRFDDTGTTTQVAGLVVFLLGGLCYWGELGVAVATAVFITLLLSYKFKLHHLVAVMEEEDVQAIIKFALITAVILPVLPNADLGPAGIFNPRMVWLMVVFISAISFAGYGLSKILGERVGITATGVLGGLASSTAVTLTFTRRCKEEVERAPSYATAIALATTTLYPRILLIIWVWSSSLLIDLVVPFLVFFVAGIAGTVWLWRSPVSKKSSRIPLTNPLEMGFALKFGLLFAVILALVRGSYELLGSQGVYFTSFFAGLEGLDAITLVIGRMVPATLEASVAAQGILLAVVANTLVKAGIVWAGKTPALRSKLIPFFLTQIVLALIFIGLA